ncbi:ADP-ribosyltransferase [Methanobrevibacter sp. DSM 116169]|uniref:ADP-ribosyltransferase n=1 Tax=Methanobrevibacter sp. DSM 116169 TaxID=3242727 RepID=UPI0038FC266E
MTFGENKINIIHENIEDKIVFGNKYGIISEDLSKKEVHFIKAYTGDGASLLNQYLRTNENKELLELKWNKIVPMDFGKIAISFDDALTIDNLFTKGKVLEKNIIVVRRETEPALFKYSKKRIYESKGFLSTSISENVKKEEYGPFLNYIFVPKGTKILYLEKITSTTDEFEVLFNIGTKLKFICKENEFKYFWKLI